MLEMRGVSLDILAESKLSILKDINFIFQPKKIYVITGPNGAGKSSLTKIIMGLYQPTNGAIFLDDQDITSQTITERAHLGIAYSFQNPPRFKGLNVRDLLTLAVADLPTKPDFFDLLFQVGLCTEDYIDRDVDATLSGGEMKRIEIATVLARRAKVAIFDEPEAGIDLWSFQNLAATFQCIHQTENTILIIISHQERIMDLADEVILMENGQISQVFNAADIQNGLLKNRCICGNDCTKGVGINAGCAR
jgi:Fe-S cluster assembly ATP-binding protein